MLKIIRLSNEPNFGKNKSSWLVFRKNNSNSKFERFGIGSNGMKYTKKLKKSKNCPNSEICLNQKKNHWKLGIYLNLILKKTKLKRLELSSQSSPTEGILTLFCITRIICKSRRSLKLSLFVGTSKISLQTILILKNIQSCNLKILLVNDLLKYRELYKVMECVPGL